MERAAAVVWTRALKHDAGAIPTQNGVVSDAPYSLVTRVENGKGITPEELISAVQAGWFGMELAAELRTITVTMEEFGGGAPLEQTA